MSEIIYLNVSIYQLSDNIEVTENRVSTFETPIYEGISPEDYLYNIDEKIKEKCEKLEKNWFSSKPTENRNGSYFEDENVTIGVNAQSITQDDYNVLSKFLNTI